MNVFKNLSHIFFFKYWYLKKVMLFEITLNSLKNNVIYVGYAWAEDKEHCEEFGRMLTADPAKVSMKAKKRGLPQVIFFIVY